MLISHTKLLNCLGERVKRHMLESRCHRLTAMYLASVNCLSQGSLCQTLNISEESWAIFLILCNCTFVWVWACMFLHVCALAVAISRKSRAKLLSSLSLRHENTITVILLWKSSRASASLSSLPPASPCHTKSLQSQSPLPLPGLGILPMVTVPCQLTSLGLTPSHPHFEK